MAKKKTVVKDLEPSVINKDVCNIVDSIDKEEIKRVLYKLMIDNKIKDYIKIILDGFIKSGDGERVVIALREIKSLEELLMSAVIKCQEFQDIAINYINNNAHKYDSGEKE